ncbi:MAG TPA: 50S ribosomal protein L13 [Patescibacteria group bacterium]|nr:50S ribosomal protein L13 [Patescibacteria group bacterium]
MKIIDGKDAILGRLAAFTAKEALKGEEIAIINCEKIRITGNRKDIRESFEEKRRRVGSTQRGPKVSRDPQKIVKRVIRGMLPNYRVGRGAIALKRIKCYVGIPKEFEKEKKIVHGKRESIRKNKFMTVSEIGKGK